jgi:solute carrier family 45 protein 1/2/4
MQEVMSHEQGRNADRGEATRVGSFAMLLYSFVAIIAGTVLPWFSQRDERLLPDTDDDEEGEAEAVRIRETVDAWRRDAHRRGRPLKLPRSKLMGISDQLTTVPFMLRNVWTAALVFFFVLMMSTFVISTVWQATVMIALVGICWAVAMWVPFAMLMEFLREIDAEHDKADRALSRGSPTATTSPATETRTLSSSTGSPDERRHLLDRPSMRRNYSAAEMETAGIENAAQGPVAGGTIMGIHNLAIVFPQFVVSGQLHVTRRS